MLFIVRFDDDDGRGGKLVGSCDVKGDGIGINWFCADCSDCGIANVVGLVRVCNGIEFGTATGA